MSELLAAAYFNVTVTGVAAIVAQATSVTVTVFNPSFHRPWLGRRESVVAVGNGAVKVAIAIKISHRKKLNVREEAPR